ncbi:MAG: O-antigen ligase family protein [Candidatus Falkowbacteria bacterium]
MKNVWRKSDNILALIWLAVWLVLPWQTHLVLRLGSLNGAVWPYGTISLYAFDLLLLSGLGFFVWQYRHTLPALLHFRDWTKRVKALFAVELWIWLAVLWSPDTALAFYVSLTITLVTLAGLAMAKSLTIFRIKGYFLAGLILPALLSLWQFFSQSSFAQKWLGLAFHSATVLGDSVVANEMGRWLRAYGSFDHPNILGGTMAIGLLVLFDMWYERREDSRWQPWFIFLAVTFFSALVASFSRSGILALALGLVVMSVNYRKYFRWWLGRIALLLLVALVFIIPYRTILFGRIESSAPLEQRSLIERCSLAEQAMQLIHDNLFFGVGPGNYTVATSMLLPGHPGWFYQPVHDAILLVWAELGLIGLLLWSVFFYFFLTGLWQRFNTLPLAIVMGMFIIILFDHWLWSLHFGIIFGWLILLTICQEDKVKT